MEDLRKLLEETSQNRRGACCCKFPDGNNVGQRTYGELFRNACAAASFLLSCGLSGRRVVLVAEPSYFRLAAFWGIVLSGNIAVVLPQDHFGPLPGEITAAFCTDLTSGMFSGPGADHLLRVCTGRQARPGFIRWADVLKTPSAAFPDLYGGDLCVAFPASRDGGAQSLTRADFFALGQSLAPASAEGTVLSYLPFFSPAGAALTTVGTAVSGCAAAWAEDPASVAVLGAYTPEIIVGTASDCKTLTDGAFRYADARCGSLEVRESVRKYFGGNLRRLYASDSAPDAGFRAAMNAVGISAAALRKDGNAVFGAQPRLPASPAESRVAAAVARCFGDRTADMNAPVPTGTATPAAVAAFALSLGLHPQTVYDAPFPFALAKQLEKETFLFYPPDAGTQALLRESGDPAAPPGDGAVLLTGAEGFFGAHLLHALIAAGRTVICPVPDKTAFMENYAAYFGKKPKNVKILPADLRQPYFGLPAARARKYRGEIAAVVHAALPAHGFGACRAYRETAEAAMENALRFSRISAAPFVLISDLRVFGGGLVPQTAPCAEADETRLFLGQKYYRDAYVHCLFRMEEAALRARGLGVRVTVIRLGRLTPRTSDGMDDLSRPSDAVASRLNALLRLGAYCGGADRFMLYCKPVDEAARETAQLLLRDCGNRVYHLPGVGRRPSEALAAAGLTLPRISDAEFLSLARKNADAVCAAVFCEDDLFYADAGEVLVRSAAAEAALGAEVAARCPQDEAYFRRFLRVPPAPAPRVYDTEPATSPAAAYRRMERRVLPPAGTLLRRGAGSLSSLSALFSSLEIKDPLLVAEEAYAGIIRLSKTLTVADGTVPERRVLSDAVERSGADGVAVLGGPSLLSAVGEWMRDASVILPRVLIPAPLGTGTGVFCAGGALNPLRDPLLPDPAAVVCDPALAAARSDLLCGQAVLTLLNALEALLSQTDDLFPTDSSFALAAAAAVFRSAPALAAGDVSAETADTLQLAAVHAAVACRRRGTGLISALTETAAKYGADPARTAAACAPHLLRAMGETAVPALAALGAALPEKKSGADAVLSALEKLLASLEGASAAAPAWNVDLRQLAVETADLARRSPCPQLAFPALEAVICRIFSDK